MAIPAPSAERRPVLIAAGFLTAIFLAQWLLLPDKTYVFDGVMFSAVIERDPENTGARMYLRIVRAQLSGEPVSTPDPPGVV